MAGVEVLDGALGAKLAHDVLGRRGDADVVARAAREEHGGVELELPVYGCGRVGRGNVGSAALARARGKASRGRGRTDVVFAHEVGGHDFVPLERGAEPAGLAPVGEHAGLVLSLVVSV